MLGELLIDCARRFNDEHGRRRSDSRHPSALDAADCGYRRDAPPPRSVGIATTVPDQPRRDRRRVVVLAAATVALIATVAALVSLRRDDRAVGSDDTAVEVAPVITAGVPRRTHPVPPIPDGWEPVEWGNLRLSLPPDMSPFNAGNGCTKETATDLEIICGDESVRISSCHDRHGHRSTAQRIAGVLAGRRVHGLPVTGASGARDEGARCGAATMPRPMRSSAPSDLRVPGDTETRLVRIRQPTGKP